MRLAVDSPVLTWLAWLTSPSLLQASAARPENRRGIGGFRAQAGSLQAANIFLKKIVFDLSGHEKSGHRARLLLSGKAG
ncbi:hypothetical protein LZ683_12485 [Comamonas testosteroni]|uniref:hypothetical protein n=1 Tax=Comamonas testosteroni TaxID=285 RepID=UPI0023AB032D|nr:hypothetical protein [Comamonas testosteroni]WEE80099.1 hypothetical protein LZ683_12485 [Comamonas testosteroni]